MFMILIIAMQIYSPDSGKPIIRNDPPPRIEQVYPAPHGAKPVIRN